MLIYFFLVLCVAFYRGQRREKRVKKAIRRPSFDSFLSDGTFFSVRFVFVLFFFSFSAVAMGDEGRSWTAVMEVLWRKKKGNKKQPHVFFSFPPSPPPFFMKQVPSWLYLCVCMCVCECVLLAAWQWFKRKKKQQKKGTSPDRITLSSLYSPFSVCLVHQTAPCGVDGVSGPTRGKKN